MWNLCEESVHIPRQASSLGTDGYETVQPDAEGWRSSPRLGRRFRLTRREVRPGRWSYRLEHDGEG